MLCIYCWRMPSAAKGRHCRASSFFIRLADCSVGVGDRPVPVGDRRARFGDTPARLGDTSTRLGDTPTCLGDPPACLGDRPVRVEAFPTSLNEHIVSGAYVPIPSGSLFLSTSSGIELRSSAEGFEVIRDHGCFGNCPGCIGECPTRNGECSAWYGDLFSWNEDVPVGVRDHPTHVGKCSVCTGDLPVCIWDCSEIAGDCCVLLESVFVLIVGLPVGAEIPFVFPCVSPGCTGSCIGIATDLFGGHATTFPFCFSSTDLPCVTDCDVCSEDCSSPDRLCVGCPCTGCSSVERRILRLLSFGESLQQHRNMSLSSSATFTSSLPPNPIVEISSLNAATFG